MVFALCDEEDFLGLLQSAVQLKGGEETGRKEIGKEKWGRWKAERRLRKKVTNIQCGDWYGKHREEERE